MTAKEYLNKARMTNETLEGLFYKLELAEQIRARGSTLRGISYNPERARGSMSADASFTNQAISAADIEMSVKRTIEECERIQAKCNEMILSIPNVKQQKVLYMRYMLNMPWKNIRQKMRCAERTLHHLHRLGLEWIINKHGNDF